VVVEIKYAIMEGGGGKAERRGNVQRLELRCRSSI
jgi:hypothetical protein